MSANVWFREVSIALLEELKSTIKVHKKDEMVYLPDNAFVVRKPEEDFKFETFPCVSIYYRDYRHNPRRYNTNMVLIEKDLENNIAVMEDSAVPFDIKVQLDFWSKYQSDMDDMTKTWLLKHFRQFNLSVVDDGGVKRNCNVFQSSNNSIMRSDLVLNKERLFHSIINYDIWVELDDETRYNVPMVATRNVVVKSESEV